MKGCVSKDENQPNPSKDNGEDWSDPFISHDGAAVDDGCPRRQPARFEAIDSLTPGQMAPVVGMSEDTFYWYILGPLSGQVCTVPSADHYGMVTGDCSGLPVFTPMPTPVDTPTNTPEPTPTMPGLRGG